MNKCLLRAKKESKDEFYTQFKDIKNELDKYKNQFENKIIYCNADDPSTSNFFKYFYDNFHNFKLKKIITTILADKGLYSCYDGKTFDKQFLKDNGDFRSFECLKILNQSDIIITNPPFSLFRDYMDTIIKSGKKFIIIGNHNSISCKNIFSHFMQGNFWLGNYANKLDLYFHSYYSRYSNYKYKGKDLIRVKGILWLTNINYGYNKKELKLTKQYNETDYPKYDNYNAIEVGKITDIPYDYDGIIGVPLTFIYFYNPKHFKIVGSRNDMIGNKLLLKGKPTYFRIFIKKV